MAPLRPMWQQMLNSRKTRRPARRIEAVVEAQIIDRPGRRPERRGIGVERRRQRGFAGVEHFIAERIVALQILGDDAAARSEPGRTRPSTSGCLPPSTGTVMSNARRIGLDQHRHAARHKPSATRGGAGPVVLDRVGVEFLPTPRRNGS